MQPACRINLAWACLGLLASCSDPGAVNNGVREAEYFVFGTRVQVTLADVDEDTANQAFTQLQARLQSWHRDWHAWEPGKLTQINTILAGGGKTEADPDLIELIRHSQWAETATGGRFNAAIGRLVALWGFHTSDYPITAPPPDAAAITALTEQNPSTLDLNLDETRVESGNPSVQLDFGGIGKGFAVDLACKLLRELDVENAIVNAGGDLRAFGAPVGRAWRVAVENPLGGVLGAMEIQGDEAVFTSGNYARYLESSDQHRYAHILDPRTGWPAAGVLSVTVVSDTGWLADAAATALVVAGLSEWNEVATPLRLDEVLITDEQGRVFATPALAARMDWAPGIKPLSLEPDSP